MSGSTTFQNESDTSHDLILGITSPIVMKYLEEITIVIPTYNRPTYLKRVVDYWSVTDIKIIIADGSDVIDTSSFSKNIIYYHDNDSTPIQRWLNAIRKVSTPYVAICADDDFYSITGINSCIEFLDNNKDYASVQGNAIEFTLAHGKQVDIKILNKNRVHYVIDAPTAKDRLRQLFDEYIYQTYSVFRTPLLVLALDACVDIKNGNYLELATAIVPTIAGKHKSLPIFFSAREAIAGSGSSYTEVPRFDVLTSEGLIDYQRWRLNLAKIYSEFENVNIDVALNIIENTFEQYNAWDLKEYPWRKPLNRNLHIIEKGSKIKKYLKKIIPDSVLRLRTKILYGAVNIPNYKPEIPGFPWTCPIAEKEWDQMRRFIYKHPTANIR